MQPIVSSRFDVSTSRAPRRRFRAVAVLFLGCVAACGGGDQLLGGKLDGGSSAGTGGATGAGGGGSDASADVEPPLDAAGDQVCGTGGSLVSFPTARGEACSGDVANRAFRFALCTCTELAWVGSLTTDSFHSTTGQRGANGAVGVDGYVVAASAYHVGGSFWVAGEPPGAPALSIATAATSDVAKDLHAGGGIAGQGAQTIRGDVFCEGNITCFGMNVGGRIHLPAGNVVTGATAAKGIVNEPVAVAKPCDCAAPAIDTARVVEAFALRNDDAAHGIAPTDLAGFIGPKSVELPCGRYYFDEIAGRDLTLRVRGAVVVAIGGDVTATGRFDVELAPGAELDVFVRGDVKLANASSFGSTTEPARIRVYVAGASVVLPAGTGLGANFYAPASLLSSGGPLEVSGSLFANRFNFTGSVTVHYDEAILGGRGCPATSGSSCATCKDCNGAAPACRQGACAACTANSDCCPPLVCLGGSCLPPGDVTM